MVKARAMDVAKYQKNIQWLILANFVAICIPFGIIITGIIGIYFIYKLAESLRSSDAWAYIILSLIPLIGLLALVHLVNKATLVLRQNGIEVSVMGARMADFQKISMISPSIATAVRSSMTLENDMSKTALIIIKIIKIVVAMVVVIPALWIDYNIGWVLFSPHVNTVWAEARVNSVGHAAILQGCREMIQNYASYTNEWHCDFPTHGYIKLSGTGSQNIPPSIRALNPVGLTLFTNWVEIRFEGPPRLILAGYHGDGAPGNGWQQLTNGLWWFSGG
jgi:hypothetical protein